MVIDMDYQALINASLLPQSSGLLASAQGVPQYGAQAAANSLMPSTNFNPQLAIPNYAQPVAAANAASTADTTANAAAGNAGGDQLSLFQKMQALGGSAGTLPGSARANASGGNYGFTNALQDMLGAWMMSQKAGD